jgi:hypothetical protein
MRSGRHVGTRWLRATDAGLTTAARRLRGLSTATQRPARRLTLSRIYSDISFIFLFFYDYVMGAEQPFIAIYSVSTRPFEGWRRDHSALPEG